MRQVSLNIWERCAGLYLPMAKNALAARSEHARQDVVNGTQDKFRTKVHQTVVNDANVVGIGYRDTLLIDNLAGVYL